MMKKIFLFALAAWFFLESSMGVAANFPSEGFSAPVGLLAMEDGSLLVAEWSANRVSKLDNSGKRSIAISGISSPAGLARDSAGNIYIAGYGDGNIYRWDGKGEPAVMAKGFQQPTGLLWSRDNALLIANRGRGTVEEVGADGKRRIISEGHNLPVGIAQTNDGSLYVSCYGGTLDRVTKNGAVQRIKNGFVTPGVGIIPASENTVLLVDNGAGAVVEAGANGVIKVLAKDLASPVGLAKTSGNEIIVATWGDGKIQFVEN